MATDKHCIPNSYSLMYVFIFHASFFHCRKLGAALSAEHSEPNYIMIKHTISKSITLLSFPVISGKLCVESLCVLNNKYHSHMSKSSIFTSE